MKMGCLRPLYGHTGDYISVYLDISRGHEKAADEVELRWRAARQRLVDAGADSGTLDAVENVVTDPARAAPGRAIFACDGAVTFTAPLSAAPRREIARLGRLPHLMPLLAQRPPTPAHLRVVANRAGGEIVTVRDGSPGWREGIAGRGWPVHKASTGGWSQLRYQRSAEETWEENAKRLAASVVDAAERVQPERIVMAGGTKARSLLLRHLTRPLRKRVVEVDREVAPDSAEMAQAADHSLTALADRECRARFGEWQARRAHSGTVEGLAATLAALRDGRVSDLFLADRPSSTASVWIGPDGADLAVSAAELRARGVPDPVRERADAAIVRALAATDAELHLLPEDLVEEADPGGGGIAFPPDGICATLRWAEAG